MRKLSIVWTVCCLATGLSACATFKPAPSRPDTAKACAEWRWIGISQPGAQCPEVPGWTVSPMFPQLSPVLPASGDYCANPDKEKVPSLDVIRELNRFCVYEIKDSKKKLKDLSFPSVASAGLVRFDRDCAALSLTAAEKERAWKPESPGFFTQVGQPKGPLLFDNRPGVRLAFLDTQPNGEGVPQVSGNSPHGYALAHIARQMICDPDHQGRCAARITTRLALPIIKFNAKSPKLSEIDTTNGGFLGMQSDLATAIIEEVRSWQREKSQRHLVLNLSMAWDGELFDGLNEEQIKDLKAGTQAVYNALQFAAESDVLVLAAAGNQKRDPCTNEGPLLPAAWERKAPHARCHDKTAQLIYAVGGLKSNDERLDNARPGGMPRRVAFGEAAIFSGSSVSTAVASSIAAVIWSAFPDLDSHEVMGILDESGPELFPADFWFGSSTQVPRAHKLMLCSAIKKACDKHGSLPAICQNQCDPGPSLESATLFEKPAKIIWKGSCQPWLFPQPQDPIRPCPEAGPCSETNM